MDKLNQLTNSITYRILERYSTLIGITSILTSTTLNFIFNNLFIFIIGIILYIYGGYSLMSKDG